VTGKVVSSLVYINRIKPYFYRDEFPGDSEAMEAREVEMKTTEPNAQQSAHKKVLEQPVEKKEGTKRRSGRPRRNTEPTGVVFADIEDVRESPSDGVAEETARCESKAMIIAAVVVGREAEAPTPDYHNMYAAKCILKQRSQKEGRREFMVR